MAAVTASMLCFLKAGDHVVAAKALFGSCRYVVEDICGRVSASPRRWSTARISAQWERAIKPGTKAVFFESPTNPTLELVDVAAVAKLAHKVGALVIVDNVFATPCCRGRSNSAPTSSSIRRPSMSTARAAASAACVLGSKKYITETLHTYLKHTGPSMSPFNAWVMLKSLETLPLRVRAACRYGGKLADHLASRPGMSRA